MKALIKRSLIRAIDSIALAAHLDLSTISNKRLGLLQYQDSIVSGERFLLEHVALRILQNRGHNVIFDVGANEGHYTSEVLRVFPNDSIHCFEPFPSTAKRLAHRFKSYPNIEIITAALSDKVGHAEIYDYGNEKGSSHASLYKSVLTDQHNAKYISTTPVELTTLDTYCDARSISRVDFLKIDTEGNELLVLRGCQKMLDAHRIGLIQFEFNEMNVVSRSFLRDFYSLLVKYELFRLRVDGLIPLGSYTTKNEVFQFQNLVAIPKKMIRSIEEFIVRKVW